MPDPLSPGPLTTKVAETLAPVVPAQVVDNLGVLAVSYDLPDFVVGGLGLVAILCYHGLSIALIYPWFERRSRAFLRRHAYWRVELLFYFSIFLLTLTHIGEIVIWALIVHVLGLIPDLRDAVTFCGSTYTTVGFSTDLMPAGWKMMNMIIALSGMFAFAWTTGIVMLMVKVFHLAQHARITGIDPPLSSANLDYLR